MNNNFCEFLDTEEKVRAYEKECGGVKPGEMVARMKDSGACENCDEHIWRLAGTGLCFSCTTGESDASEDYEIGEWHA